LILRFFGKDDLSELTEVAELAAIAVIPLHIESDAGIDGAGIDMDADSSFSGFAQVIEAMYRLQLVCGDHWAPGACLGFTHDLESRMIRAGETIEPDHILIFGVIAAEPSVIDHTEVSPLWDHPAYLPIMSMNCGPLPRLPADRHHLKKIVTIDQITSIEPFIEEDIWTERGIADLQARAKIEHIIACDYSSFERLQPGSKIIDTYQLPGSHLMLRFTMILGLQPSAVNLHINSFYSPSTSANIDILLWNTISILL
jgi:hypothetical protein